MHFPDLNAVTVQYHLCRWILVAAGAVSGVAHAQLAALPVDQLDSVGRRQSPALLGTPEELLVDVEIDDAMQRGAIDPRDSGYSSNALTASVVARAQVWLDSLSARPVTGLHQDAYGRLAAVAGHAALAQREIAARAATRGLSIADQAYTWYVGAMVFAHREHPEWLPIAEAYVAKLTTLGGPAAAWQYRARREVALTYYQLGRGSVAATEALKTYALLSSLPFEEHALALDDALYLATADALALVPNRVARLQAVDSLLLSAARPSADRIALDSDVVWSGVHLVDFVHRQSAFASTIGKAAPPATSNFWINTADTADETQPLAPGVVHLLCFFQPELSSFLPSLLGLVRIQTRLGSSVDVTGIASLSGHWGLTFVDPPAEAAHWRQYFQQVLRLPFRIALWVKPKEPTPWGGLLSPPNPTFAAYRVPSGNAVIVVDRSGRVRRLFPLGGDAEDDLVHYVQALDTLGQRAAVSLPSSR